jgi:hypothetical protein
MSGQAMSESLLFDNPESRAKPLTFIEIRTASKEESCPNSKIHRKQMRMSRQSSRVSEFSRL